MKQTDLEEFYQKSKQPKRCERLFEQALRYVKENDMRVTKHQEQSLLNHISEMILRDVNMESIIIEDKSVFNELSQVSIKKAEEIVNQLEHPDESEVLLLAIHFEVAKNQL